MKRELQVSCDECRLCRLGSTRNFSDIELEAVKRFKVGDVILAAGSDILRIHDESAHLWTLYSGHAFRYVLLPDGRRQILSFLLPSDFIGLQASLLDPAEHAVTALTDVHLCVFERKNIVELFREAPQLGFDVTWATARELSHVDLNLVAAGKFRADQRIAYLLLWYYERMRQLGLAEDSSCAFPLRQQHVADCLGLSLPYTNLALGTLARQRVVRVAGGRLRVADWDAFRERAIVTPRLAKTIRFI